MSGSHHVRGGGVEICAPLRHAWTHTCAVSPHATFFHTPYWHQLAVAMHPDARDVTFVGTLSTGERFVLPLVERRRGAFARDLMSGAAGVYGGPLSERLIEPDERTKLYAALVDRRTRLVITENPYDVVPRIAFARRALQLRRDSTHVLSLARGYAAVLRGCARGHRSAINRSIRSGVEVRRAVTEQEYRAYYGLYLGALARWGNSATSRYSWSVFEAARHAATESGNAIQLWLAKLGEVPVAGALTFWWNDRVYYWHGAGDRSADYARPTSRLFTRIIEDACERGYKSLDFMPSGGHEGSAEFKRRFGAEEIPVHRYVHAPPVWRAEQAAKTRVSSLLARAKRRS